MFAEAIESILKDYCTPQAVRAIENGGAPDALRGAIAEAGFFELLAEEDDGGAAITMQEFYPIVALCGAFAMPLPLAQTMAVRLLAGAGAQLPEGLITFGSAEARQDAEGGISCGLVPFALSSDHVVLRQGDALLLLPTAQAERTPTGVHGSLAASLRWKAGAAQPLPGKGEAATLQRLGAVLYAGMLAGAAKRVFDITLQYGNDRVQFGKSIGKFQAIQHQMSIMAEHTAASAIAAETAYQCGRRVPAPLACAVAKSRTSEAAQLIASIAHAVHGAIGVTDEYDLHLYTRRLHEWRMTHGSESYWNRMLGEEMLGKKGAMSVDFIRAIVA